MISKIPTTLTEILEAAQQDCSVNKCRFVTPDRRPFSDIAPIAFIERISDVSFSDFTFDFHDKMKSHKLLKKPLIALRYTPCQIRFQPTIKDEYGAIFFLCRWHTMTESTESIIAEYCLMSRRRFGWYDPANQTVTGIPTIRLKYCTLVSEVDIAKKSPKFDFLKEVKKLLRKRIDSELEINHWEIEETLAHSQKHVSAIRNEAISRAKALEREMCLEFGMPVKLSAKSRKEIRFGGVEYSVAWQIGAKRVFLVVNNDDVGLPFQLILLVRVKGEKREK